MRCISGISWGAIKSTLVTTYKSLILSTIDYCSFIYSNTALTNSKRLDTIQYKALLLVTGGIKGTSLNALLGECAYLLYLEEQNQQSAFFSKLHITQKTQHITF